MDDVPVKIPMILPPAVEEDIGITLPDYLSILQETEYEFSLENWTLAGLQGGLTDHRWPQRSSSSSGLQPSCPPYWMMFRSSQQSCLATCHFSNLRETNPKQCSQSLHPSVLSSTEISKAEDDVHSVTQKASLPSLPASINSWEQQHKKDLPQRSLSVQDISKKQDLNRLQDSPFCTVPDISPPNTRVKPARRLPSTSNDPKHALLNTLCSETSPPNSPQSIVSCGLDSSSEVLAALSPEERELLNAITGRGYPLQTAIVALQKAGHQTSDQVFSYLVACDHLCQLGYHMAQVEEALEMFQNCETKAEEFLHLLTQFDEMGFQQNAIKEVLLIHENHRERALEELMLRLSC